MVSNEFVDISTHYIEIWEYFHEYLQHHNKKIKISCPWPHLGIIEVFVRRVLARLWYMLHRTLKTNLEHRWPLKSNLELRWPPFVCHVIWAVFATRKARTFVRSEESEPFMRRTSRMKKTSVRENTYVWNGPVEYAHWLNPCCAIGRKLAPVPWLIDTAFLWHLSKIDYLLESHGGQWNVMENELSQWRHCYSWLLNACMSLDFGRLSRVNAIYYRENVLHESNLTVWFNELASVLSWE